MVRILWFLNALLFSGSAIIQQTQGLTTEASVTENKNGSENFFDEFIAPIVKYGMMTSGNKTESEADSVLSIISTAVKNRATLKSVKTESITNEENQEKSSKDTVFQDYIAPIIRYEMTHLANVTEKETDAVLDSFSQGSSKSASEKSAPTNPFKSDSFFQDYIAPVIRHGMITSGNKTEAEADAILDIITTAVKNRTSSSSYVTDETTEAESSESRNVDAASSRLFSNYISPMIRFGLLKPTAEIEADSSSANSNTENGSPETSNVPNNSKTAKYDEADLSPRSFFENFIVPIIKHEMVTFQNKTENEADDILKIIISSKKNETNKAPADLYSSLTSETHDNKTKPGSFFHNYIVPMMRYKMLTKGNKTEQEADYILNMISSSIKAAAVDSNDQDPSTAVGFFKRFVSPIIRYGIRSFTNESESEAAEILAKITSNIESKAAKAASEDKDQEKVSTGVEDASPHGDAFFLKFIAPMIRYNIINSSNKTEEEADAILDIISADKTVSPEVTEMPEGSFFQNFVAPIIRNRLVTSDMKNESETNSIMKIITTVVDDKKAVKTSNIEESSLEQESESSSNAYETETKQETGVVIKDLLLPEIDDVISKGTPSNLNLPADDIPIFTETNKETVQQIQDDIRDIIDSNHAAKTLEDKTATVDENEDSQEDSKPLNSDGGLQKVNDTIGVVISLIDNRLTPVLTEKIQGLKGLSDFFSNPTVLSGLRKSLKDVVTTIHESASVESSPEYRKQFVHSVESKTSRDPLKWFVGRVVTPEIQKQMGIFDEITNGLSNDKNPEFLPRSTKSDYRMSQDEDDVQRTSSKTAGTTFFKDVIVPRLKKEAQTFKSIAAKFSTADGQKSISSSVEEFADKTMSLRSKMNEFRKSKYAEDRGYKTRDSKRSVDPDSKTEVKSDDVVDSFVDGFVMPAIEKKAKTIQTIAEKLNNPEKINEIVNVVKTRIQAAIERKKKSLCAKKSCEEKIIKAKNYDKLHGKEHPTRERGPKKAEDIVKQIVQLKTKISKDRIQIQSLETQIDKLGSYEEKIALISEQSKAVEDIKESSMALQESFRNLRGDQTYHYRQIPNFQSFNGKQAEKHEQGYTEKVEIIIEEINNLIREISEVRLQITEVEKKMSIEYIYRNRLALASEKFKLVGEMTSKTTQLNKLYEDLRYAQAAMKTVGMEQEENTGTEDFLETDFTDAEKAQYAGLLGELNYAVDTNDKETESGGNITALFVGCAIAISGTVILGLVIFRRRTSRHNLYKRIPNETDLGAKVVVNETENSYGSFSKST